MRYFDISEFDCKETGENEMDEKFLNMIDWLRHICEFPFVITSGYRSVKHSAEANKPNGGGTHTKGIAADIAVSNGAQRMKLVQTAIDMGFNGIGGANGFVHVDIRDAAPVMWVY